MFKIIDHPSIKPNTYAVDEYGTVKNINTGKILKPYLNEHGYWYIGLQTPDGRRKQFGVYRLVALCHVPNPDQEHFDWSVQSQKYQPRILSWYHLHEDL